MILSEKGHINSFLIKYFSFTSFLSYFSLVFPLSPLALFLLLILTHHSSLKNSKSAIHHDGLSTKSYACFQFSSVQSLSRVRLFATPRTTACQGPLSITNSQSPRKLMSIESVMPSNHLILVVPFSSCLQSFPASELLQ